MLALGPRVVLYFKFKKNQRFVSKTCARVISYPAAVGVIFRRPTLTRSRPGKLTWPEGRLRDGTRSASLEYLESRRLCM